MFWRLKITKKTQYNTKNPGWFHVKQEKTAKITTINSEFFCNDKQSGKPRSVFLACVPRETLFFLKYSVFLTFVPRETLFFSKNQQFLQLVFRLGYAFLRKLVIFVVSVPRETQIFT